MGFADVRPFPIPSLVRYKLIDSCSVVVYRPVSAWYATAIARATEGRKREREREREREIEAGLCTATTIPN